MHTLKKHQQMVSSMGAGVGGGVGVGGNSGSGTSQRQGGAPENNNNSPNLAGVSGQSQAAIDTAAVWAAQRQSTDAGGGGGAALKTGGPSGPQGVGAGILAPPYYCPLLLIIVSQYHIVDSVRNHNLI